MVLFLQEKNTPPKRSPRGDALDFHEGPLGQGRDLHAAAGRVGLAEHFRIHLIDGAEIGQILHKDGGLDHVGQGQPGFRQNGLQVF